MKQESQTSVCPACSLLCDDIVVSSDGVVDTHGCEKGASFFQIETVEKPSHYVGGKPVSLDAAVTASADILAQSKAPLICGLDQFSTQAQQVAWKIADRIGGSIDTTLTNHGRSSLFSLQKVGKVTASLGEIAQRSDLVLFWFCDPVKTHPRLLERLERLGPRGPMGRTEIKRRIVVVGESGNLTAPFADQFLELSADRAAAALCVLRAQLSGVKVATQSDLGSLSELAELLRSAQYGSAFYGQTADDSAFDLANESLAALVRTLNRWTRFVAMKLRTDANAISAENVLSWSSGFAMAANHASGFPRSNWLEHSAETILTRGECDAVLLGAGANLEIALAGLSQAAQQHLASVPRIVLSPTQNVPVEVSIAVGVPGLNDCGEYCRNDDVSMPLLPVLPVLPLPGAAKSSASEPECDRSPNSADTVALVALRAILDRLSVGSD